MKNKYTISEIRPRIFFLKFKNHYDLCMQFVRYQEFYESASPRFRDKPFDLLDYMRWYAHKYGEGVFTYPNDWGGFNLPAEVIKRVWDLGIADRNIYDYEMKALYNKFLQQYPDGQFYIIGAGDSGLTMKHEIAHGFFYTIPEYKVEMTKLVKKLKKSFFKSMCNSLRDIGYTRRVYVDECQAYLSTGVPTSFDLTVDKENEPFIQLYQKYY
jgi:hypothetical protein